MFDHVIVAYDGSDHSEDALALARVLTSRAGRITAASAYWFEARSARVGVEHGGDSERGLAVRREEGARDEAGIEGDRQKQAERTGAP